MVLGYTDVPLNVGEHEIRTSETNMGDFLADLANLYNETDVAILNSGSIRYDNVVPVGEVRLSVFKVNYDCDLYIKEVSGEVLLSILERSVSSLPSEAGSFLQVSGIHFTYDLTKPVRIQSVKVNGHPLNPKKNYTVTCSDYLAAGGDGYDMLKDCKTLLDGASAIGLMQLIHKFFRVYDLKIERENVKKLLKNAEKMLQKVFKHFHLSNDVEKSLEEKAIKLHGRAARIRTLRVGIRAGEDGRMLAVIGPKEDGRIVDVNK